MFIQNVWQMFQLHFQNKHSSVTHQMQCNGNLYVFSTTSGRERKINKYFANERLCSKSKTQLKQQMLNLHFCSWLLVLMEGIVNFIKLMLGVVQLYQTFLVAVTLDINTDSGKKRLQFLLNKFSCSLNEQSKYKLYKFKHVLLVLRFKSNTILTTEMY